MNRRGNRIEYFKYLNVFIICVPYIFLELVA